MPWKAILRMVETLFYGEVCTVIVSASRFFFSILDIMAWPDSK